VEVRAEVGTEVGGALFGSSHLSAKDDEEVGGVAMKRERAREEQRVK
jgi:hypothetical protein